MKAVWSWPLIVFGAVAVSAPSCREMRPRATRQAASGGAPAGITMVRSSKVWMLWIQLSMSLRTSASSWPTERWAEKNESSPWTVFISMILARSSGTSSMSRRMSSASICHTSVR